jgi:hypothetical protein
MKIVSTLSGEIVDEFEIKLDRFADIAEGVLARLSFTDATRKGGDGPSEAAIFTRLQDDLQLHDCLRDFMLTVVAASSTGL